MCQQIQIQAEISMLMFLQPENKVHSAPFVSAMLVPSPLLHPHHSLSTSDLDTWCSSVITFGSSKNTFKREWQRAVENGGVNNFITANVNESW